MNRLTTAIFSTPKFTLYPTIVLILICAVPENYWEKIDSLGFHQFLSENFQVIRRYAAASDFPVTTTLFIAALPFCFFSSLIGYIHHYYKNNLIDKYFLRREEKIKAEGVFSVLKFDLINSAFFAFILIASLSLAKDPAIAGSQGVNHNKFIMLTLMIGGWVYGFPFLLFPVVLDFIFFSKKILKLGR